MIVETEKPRRIENKKAPQKGEVYVKGGNHCLIVSSTQYVDLGSATRDFILLGSYKEGDFAKTEKLPEGTLVTFEAL